MAAAVESAKENHRKQKNIEKKFKKMKKHTESNNKERKGKERLSCRLRLKGWRTSLIKPRKDFDDT